MIYDFNLPVDRSRNASVKYDSLESKFGSNDIIPLWIADMDIMVAMPIQEALRDRVDQGVYGYTTIPESYYEAVSSWQKRRNDWEPNTQLMSFALGVVPAINGIIDVFSSIGDEIFFCTPVYNHFAMSVKNRNRKPLTSALVEKDGHYSIGFEDFEEKLKRKPAMFILCNPHNPVGRVWTKDELVKMAELCIKYDVLIISDEIHSDLVLWDNRHVPLASISKEISDNTITCVSGTKTFNLAGLQACTMISPNMKTKEKLDDFWDRLDISSVNCFAQVAMEAAFNEGEDWLEQLLGHLEGNIKFTKEFIDKYIPKIKLEMPESTYLLWLDCREFGFSCEELREFMIKKAGIALNCGEDYGEDGEGFMRMNIACPRPLLEKALNQLKGAVDNL